MFVAGAALNGLAWGSAALLFYDPGSPAHQIFLAFVLGGMAAGAAASNASHAPAFAAFAAPALLPLMVRFAAERDPVHAAMSFMLALFGVAVAAISRTGSRAVDDAIRLRFTNERLVAHLTAARESLAALNTALERRVEERTVELERMLALRRRSEARLARFRGLLDQIGDAILVAQAHDLEVVDVNAGACELLEASPEALLGRRLDDLGVVATPGASGADAVLASLGPGEVRTLEERRVRRDGTSRAIELKLAVQDVEGQRYVLVAARDVSSRTEMEHRLAQAELLASVGRLAAGVAHEVNNPLAYIIANLGHLRARIREMPYLPASEREELDEVIGDSLEGAGRVRRIVRDLAALSPRAKEVLEPLEVHAVLERCVNLAMGEIRRRATVVRELQEVPPVIGDRARVVQVFLNLLANAAEAIPEGDPAAHRITLRTRFDGADGRVEVEVSDTGGGIPAADLERVFEPFYSTKRVGRGLGLAMCHGIVTALGGRISARSREGEGSTFTVSLPAAPPEQR